MGSRASLVHSSLTRLSPLVASIHGVLNLRDGFDNDVCQVLHIYALLGILFHIEFLLEIVPQKVENVLHVDLKVGASH